MRKILLPLAIMGTMSMPMLACDVENSTDTPDGTTTPDGTNTELPDVDTTQPAGYFAVIVTDEEVFPTHRSDGGNPCATASSPLNAHGADIDAIGLFDSGMTLLGYLDTVDYKEGGLCPNKLSTRMDSDKAKGRPDASLTEGFVSLGGGWLSGEFDAALEIVNGYNIVVYEVGKKCGSNNSCGGIDEGYEVFVATDLNCAGAAGAAYPWGNCADQLGGEAEGESTIAVSGI